MSNTEKFVMQETPVPGTYNTPDFITELKQRPNTYNFKALGRPVKYPSFHDCQRGPGYYSTSGLCRSVMRAIIRLVPSNFTINAQPRCWLLLYSNYTINTQ